MGFDVFLSHNSNNKSVARDLKTLLVASRVSCWLDEDELRPGMPFQQLLEGGIRDSASVAVLVGADGLGPWEDEEMQAALRLAVKDRRPVIPVLLPGAPSQPELPMFLGSRTWVDLREGLSPAGIDKLVWGITGKKPDQHSVGLSSADLERLEEMSLILIRLRRAYELFRLLAQPDGTLDEASRSQIKTQTGVDIQRNQTDMAIRLAMLIDASASFADPECMRLVNEMNAILHDEARAIYMHETKLPKVEWDSQVARFQSTNERLQARIARYRTIFSENPPLPFKWSRGDVT